ncbi:MULTISPECIES: hypothetical protein [Clavibacter]|uniref:Uncharacterized protein n=2 Tax=Clavibacter TaxID=1573 RepID=A0A399NP10_9MICO|nr:MULTISPECIES: hypothetical protein [Clavibacter]RII95903.1 hypothetical protein DZF96_13365 [Clavibacter michiganensis]UKF24832.1 hypothetical protein KYT88_14115 [Clavibacter sp. A6099]
MSPTLLALDAVHQASAHIHHAMDTVAIDVPDGQASAPDDWTEKFGRIIGIAKWVLLPLAVLSLIATGAMLFRNNRHEGGEIQERLIKIGFGLFLGLGAASLVSFVIA